MSLGPRAAGSPLINVVVETPAGSRNKFKFDEKLGLFLLHKTLPVGAAFPFDFGFVPGTRADDGDPLDVMVVGGEPTFTGCLVTVRLLGVIEARQKEKGSTIRNDRLIGTPETAKIRPVGRSLSDLPARLIDQIEHVETRNHGRATARGRIGAPERSTHRAARGNKGSPEH
jgi:inorganic pyrophosphatase